MINFGLRCSSSSDESGNSNAWNCITIPRVIFERFIFISKNKFYELCLFSLLSSHFLSVALLARELINCDYYSTLLKELQESLLYYLSRRQRADNNWLPRQKLQTSVSHFLYLFHSLIDFLLFFEILRGPRIRA